MKNEEKDAFSFGIQFGILKPDFSKHFTLYFFGYTENLALIDFSYISEHSALFHVRHHIDHKGSEEHLGNIIQSLPSVQVLEHRDQIQGSI